MTQEVLYTSYEIKMSVKALFARSCIVSSKGTLVNREDTSYFFPNNWFNTTYDLNLTKTDLVDLLSVATKGQLFQYGQTDGVACNGMPPFLGIQLLNRSPQIETKVYIKPTNSRLLLHYQSHVDSRFKNGLLRSMLDRAHRLSSSWIHFSDECDRLKTVFSRLKYPKHLVNSTIKSFVDSKVCDQ